MKVLEQKAASLQKAAGTLRNIIASVDSNHSIPWENIIKMIEVYKMTAHLEHSWVKELFTTDELRQYAEFEQEMKATNTKKVFEEKWQELLNDLKKNMEKAPDSPTGIQFGKKYMDFINGIYGKKYAHLRTRKWEKGFAEGKGLDEVGLTPEIMSWLEKAIDAYWRDRLMGILGQIGKMQNSEVLTLWNKALDDMFGEETARKDAIYDIALKEESLSPEAKIWLESIRKTRE